MGVDVVVVVVVVVVLKCTCTEAGSFFFVNGINTVCLITLYFLLFYSFRDVQVISVLLLHQCLLVGMTPINGFNIMGLGVLGLYLKLNLSILSFFYIFVILSFFDIFKNDIFEILSFFDIFQNL